MPLFAENEIALITYILKTVKTIRMWEQTNKAILLIKNGWEILLPFLFLFLSFKFIKLDYLAFIHFSFITKYPHMVTSCTTSCHTIKNVKHNISQLSISTHVIWAHTHWYWVSLHAPFNVFNGKHTNTRTHTTPQHSEKKASYIIFYLCRIIKWLWIVCMQGLKKRASAHSFK